jgi:hypothetical protein
MPRVHDPLCDQTHRPRQRCNTSLAEQALSRITDAAPERTVAVDAPRVEADDSTIAIARTAERADDEAVTIVGTLPDPEASTPLPIGDDAGESAEPPPIADGDDGDPRSQTPGADEPGTPLRDLAAEAPSVSPHAATAGTETSHAVGAAAAPTRRSSWAETPEAPVSEAGASPRRMLVVAGIAILLLLLLLRRQRRGSGHAESA